jgi:outer membrane protein assembly factor BamA
LLAYSAIMRSPLAQIVTVCIFAVLPLHAQNTATTKPCPALPGPVEEKAPVPRFQIAEVTFSGSLELPQPEQEQIAESIKQRVNQEPGGNSLKGIADDASELAREGWQNYGYFRAQVDGKPRTLASSASRQTAFELRIEEGLQYRLGEVTFKGSKVFSDAFLRGLFPIQGGELLSRKKFAQLCCSLEK